MAKSSTHGVRYIGLATIDDNGVLLKGQSGLTDIYHDNSHDKA